MVPASLIPLRVFRVRPWRRASDIRRALPLDRKASRAFSWELRDDRGMETYHYHLLASVRDLSG